VTIASAQVANDADGLYDTTTLVDTNNNSTSTSTVNSTSTNTNTNNNTNTTSVDSTSTNTNVNTNNNINSGEQTFNNNNVNTSTSTNTNNNTSTNTNNNTSSSTSINANTNTNNNVNTGDMTNRNINESTVEQTVKSPPPTAVAPGMMSGGNSDLCTTGSSGAVQTQILGVASGGTIRDLNCERLKNAKVLYDMGMKVAAVSTLCQDRRVFDAMWHAGTPCPFDGMIGEAAKKAWTDWPDRIPKPEEPPTDDFYKKTGFGALIALLLLGI
jgi:hypothetical protein